MIRSTLIALAASAAFASPVWAYEPLPTTDPLRVIGSNNPGADPFYLDPGPAGTPIANPYEDPLTIGDELLPVFELPGYLNMLAYLETPFELPDEEDPNELEEVGMFQDAVFEDTRDGSLIFGSRIVIEPGEEGEINDVFRRGFTGYSANVGWVAITALDLRIITAARTTNSGVSDDPDTFDADTIDLQTDINVEEGAPLSAWFLIQTNAPGYALRTDAVGLYQAGEEDQPLYLTNLDGFAPVPVPAALPLLASALGLMGVPALRRRVRKATEGV